MNSKNQEFEFGYDTGETKSDRVKLKDLAFCYYYGNVCYGMCNCVFAKKPGPTTLQRTRGEIIAYSRAGLSATEISRLCNVHVS